MCNPTVSPLCGKRKAAGLCLEQPRLRLSFLLISFPMKMLVRACREFLGCSSLWLCMGSQLTLVVYWEPAHSGCVRGAPLLCRSLGWILLLVNRAEPTTLKRRPRCICICFWVGFSNFLHWKVSFCFFFFSSSF